MLRHAHSTRRAESVNALRSRNYWVKLPEADLRYG
jgi:hypothetical protein